MVQRGVRTLRREGKAVRREGATPREDMEHFGGARAVRKAHTTVWWG